MVTTRPPKTIVKPTALGPVANTDTKLLIYGLFQKGRVLAQDEVLRTALWAHHAIVINGGVAPMSPSPRLIIFQTPSAPRRRNG